MAAEDEIPANIDRVTVSAIAKYFGEVAERGNRGPIGELAVLLSQGRLDPSVFKAHAQAHGLDGEVWFKRQVLDLSLGFIRNGLGANTLTAGYLADIRSVNAFLHIADGDFYAFRPAEVAAVLGEQLALILEDAEISKDEELLQVELQGAFGLGYDEYLALGRTAFERAFLDLQLQSAMPDADSQNLNRKLAALAPIHRLATLQKRTLGALY